MRTCPRTAQARLLAIAAGHAGNERDSLTSTIRSKAAKMEVEESDGTARSKFAERASGRLRQDRQAEAEEQRALDGKATGPAAESRNRAGGQNGWRRLAQAVPVRFGLRAEGWRCERLWHDVANF